MRRGTKVFLHAESIDTTQKVVPIRQTAFNKFISSSIKDLDKGRAVTVFSTEQLKELKTIFGDSLSVHKISNSDSWSCTLLRKEEH